jgi:hypothetical protein
MSVCIRIDSKCDRATDSETLIDTFKVLKILGISLRRLLKKTEMHLFVLRMMPQKKRMRMRIIKLRVRP